MHLQTSNILRRDLRMLAVIACYGHKNVELLQETINDYRTMTLQVDVVVVSNIPRDLGADVEVIVGLPSENPWSLPFAHRAVFARNVDRYDLFAYSEDDMCATEDNIQAFVEVSASLADDEIAGFLRYEVDSSGQKSLPDVHGGYRWRPESARRSGGNVVAEFSNEHAAFYLLTQAQLRRMMSVDCFVRPPYEGRYDMLCSAATDPYTAYALRKVIVVSAFDRFLIHHRSNRYAGKVGVPLSVLRQQVEALLDVADGLRPASTLLPAESRWPQGAWAKDCYERPRQEVLDMVPIDAATILSVGCGWGATEEQLQHRGARVVAMPLDSILGSLASSRGLEVIDGSFNECIERLVPGSFDCVMLNDLLHLLPEPLLVLARCSKFVREGGTLLVSGPNFDSLRVLAKRAINKGGYRKLRSFEESGINLVRPGLLRDCLKPSGFDNSAVHWSAQPTGRTFDSKFGRWGSANWVMRARHSTEMCRETGQR